MTVDVSDPSGNQRTDNTAYLLVNHSGPLVTMNKTLTTDTTPALSGTVSDNTAQILVIVNGNSYQAVNNADGTWTLPDNTITALVQGTYTATVVATDLLGNTSTINGTLSIANTLNLSLGSAVTSVIYFDADGTKVTLTAGKGNLNVAFTGLNVSVAGTGKSRTVTANGGIMMLAVEVVQDTQSLTVTAAKGGDALTTIQSITGSGILTTLTGSNLIVGGTGINMQGRIQTINVYSILADVTMNAATLPTKGVSITAGVVKNSSIQIAYIKSFSVLGVLRNATVSATDIASLTVKGSYENSSIISTSIGTAALYNVDADNGGVLFGLTATTLKKLSLMQGKTTLLRGKDFTTNILDFTVNA